MLFKNKPLKDILIALGFGFICIFLVLSAVWTYNEFISKPPYVDPDKYPIRGIDVSAHNGEIDFHKVAASGINFVFIKASEGTDFNDRYFHKNFLKAREAGLKIGVYHFFRFDKEGVDQGVNFIRTIGALKPDIGYVIDVEKSGNPDSIPDETVKRRLFSMVDYMNLLGIRVTFYSNIDGYYDYIAESFPGSPLWICSFRNHPINAEWSFWQFNHHGKIDGIEGDVDLNAFCGDYEEWKSFLNGELWPYAPALDNNPS